MQNCNDDTCAVAPINPGMIFLLGVSCVFALLTIGSLTYQICVTYKKVPVEYELETSPATDDAFQPTVVD